jgi:hypothetical protein
MPLTWSRSLCVTISLSKEGTFKPLSARNKEKRTSCHDSGSGRFPGPRKRYKQRLDLFEGDRHHTAIDKPEGLLLIMRREIANALDKKHTLVDDDYVRMG